MLLSKLVKITDDIRPVLVLVTFLGIGLSPSLLSQESSTNRARPSAQFERWAARHAQRIDSTEPTADTSDLHAMSELVGSTRVVALGEPAHGAHEPLAFRNRLFEYLVETQGFSAIAIESALPESRRVADFVNGRPGEAAQVVRDNLSYGFGALHENVDLVQWMREYNANPAHHPVRFYGIDLNLGGPRGYTPTRTALDDALDYLARVSPREADESRLDVQPFLSRLPAVASFTAQEHARFATVINLIIAVLQRHRPRSTNADYEWALRDAFVARDAERQFTVAPATGPLGTILPDEWQPADLRNRAMADNVQWVLRQEGQAGRLFVFAHNAHVMNARYEGGVWSAFAKPPSAMGAYLRSAFGKELVIIGTTSTANPPGLPTWTPDASNLDAALARVGLPQYVLDLRAARADRAANEWLAERHTVRANFTTSLTLAPQQAFDALVFFNDLTQARMDSSPRSR
jgi:erythromycin esterase